jgi:hypothetical protein
MWRTRNIFGFRFSIFEWRAGDRLRSGVVALCCCLAPIGLAEEIPGEAWARRGAAGIEAHGDVGAERPMGSLAKLVWVDLEGGRWEGEGRRFRCTGAWQGHPCWLRQGHGEVDFSSALRESCNLAFLAWAQQSVERWTRHLGPSVARQKLEAAFRPFLGERLPPGERSPRLGTFWVGDGDLLRTSPAAFLAWLEDPLRADLRQRCANVLGAHGRWVKSGTAAVPGRTGATGAWAAGEAGGRSLVLYLPVGRGKVEGLARFHELASGLAREETWTAPIWQGDPDAEPLLEESLQTAFRSTAAFGPWPSGPWKIRLHEEASGFDGSTQAPAFRAAAWVEDTLHLRPWNQLDRRDLGALLRHEFVHRRLGKTGLRPWVEESRCLWAEGHTRNPEVWPGAPDADMQDRLDQALRRGRVERQAWAYGWIRSWLTGTVLRSE